MCFANCWDSCIILVACDFSLQMCFANEFSPCTLFLVALILKVGKCVLQLVENLAFNLVCILHQINKMCFCKLSWCKDQNPFSACWLLAVWPPVSVVWPAACHRKAVRLYRAYFRYNRLCGCSDFSVTVCFFQKRYFWSLAISVELFWSGQTGVYWAVWLVGCLTGH